MFPSLYQQDHTIFRNRDVLELDFVPEEFKYRDSQMKELAYCLQPGLHGFRPVNAVLRGVPGTGKTTSVKRIFAEVEQATKRMVPVYVNCQGEKTLFSILSHVHCALFGHAPPALGTPSHVVLDRIGKHLVEEDLVLVVCLDDANYLLADKVLNAALYALLRLHETCRGCRSGIILTMGTLETNLLRALDPAVTSVFNPVEISFPPYTREETRSILEDRVRRALYPGAVPDDLLDFITGKAVASGDLRVGIDILRRASLAAERAGRMVLEREHVREACEASQNLHLEKCVKVLTKEEQELLGLIARLILADPDCPLTTGDLFESVQMEMKMSYSAFHKRIRKFDEMRLIRVRPVRLGNGGQSRTVVLRFAPHQVVKACG